MKKVLIVEDDKGIIEKIKKSIQGRTNKIFIAQNIKDALDILEQNVIDVVVLDRVLITGQESEDGLTVCKEIRANPKKYRNPYVVILTGELLDIEDKKEGYLAGASVYFNKKTEFELFILAMISQLKDKNHNNEVIKYCKIALDLRNGTIKENNKDVYISNSEYIILLELLKHQGERITKDELKKYCWGINSLVSDNSLRTTICRLRQKFKDIDGNLETKRYQGYYLKEKD